MRATIGNPVVRTAEEFHRQIAGAFLFPDYYGRNLDALWDVLRIDIERPSELIWLDAKLSRKAMPSEFKQLVRLFEELATEDEKHGLPPFSLILR
jgi:ribonuclease inhibitor